MGARLGWGPGPHPTLRTGGVQPAVVRRSTGGIQPGALHGARGVPLRGAPVSACALTQRDVHCCC